MNSAAPEMAARKTLEHWLAEGESIYAELLKDVQQLEAQMAELHGRIRQKRMQAEQIARVLGKSTPESSRHPSQGSAPAPAEAGPVDEALRIRLPYGKPPVPRPARTPGSEPVPVPLRE